MSSGTNRKMHGYVPPHHLYNQNSREGVVDSRRPYSFQDRVMQLPFPSTRIASTSSYSPVRVFMLDASDSARATSYPTPPRRQTLDSPRRFIASTRNDPAMDVPKLTRDEKQNALSKLRKERYNPTMLKGSTNKDWEILSHKAKKDQDGKISCAICLEDFEVQEFVTSTPCNHMFHNDCIVPWVKNQGRCPICRCAII